MSVPEPALPSSTRRAGASAPTVELRGIGFTVLAASLFGLNTISARLAFEGGTDAVTGNATRFAFTLLVLFAWLALKRGRATLAPRQRLAGLALGIPFALCSFGYLGSIQYIPVSIAVLVLYSYPVLVGLIARVVEREPLGGMRVAALVLAFLGLALALDAQAAALPDWRGLALAALAAAAFSVMIVGGGRLMREADRAQLNLHLMMSASVVLVVALFAGGGPSWPKTEGGWLAFAALLVTFAAAQIALIAGLGRAGPVLTAAVMNLEPVITILLAMLLVGERMTLLQISGAAMVVLAIFLMGSRRRHSGAILCATQNGGRDGRRRPTPVPPAEP